MLKGLWVVEHLLYHGLCMWVVEHFLHFLWVNCWWNRAHVPGMIHDAVSSKTDRRTWPKSSAEVVFGNDLLLGRQGRFLYFFGLAQDHHNSGTLEPSSTCLFLINQDFSLKDKLYIQGIIVKQLSNLLLVLFDSFVLLEL